MKLGVDTHVSHAARRALVAAGHEIVVVAQCAEPDAVWLGRAVAAGAVGVVSADKDFATLAHRAGVHWINFPGGRPNVRYILWRLSTLVGKSVTPPPRVFRIGLAAVGRIEPDRKRGLAQRWFVWHPSKSGAKPWVVSSTGAARIAV